MQAVRSPGPVVKEPASQFRFFGASVPKPEAPHGAAVVPGSDVGDGEGAGSTSSAGGVAPSFFRVPVRM